MAKTPDPPRPGRRKRRLLWVLGISTGVLLGVYLARRPLFESMIRGEIAAALRTELGVETEIGAVTGNWLTSVTLQGVTIRGGEQSAIRAIEDVDIVLGFSLYQLARGDLRGLRQLQVTGRRAEFHVDKSWLPARPPAPAAGPGPGLDDLLGMFAGGVRLRIEQLVLAPDYVGKGAIAIELAPGTTARRITLTAPGSTATAHIDPAGKFTAEVRGAQAGRLVRALRLAPRAVDDGELEITASGSAPGRELQSELQLTTRTTDGARLSARYRIEWRDGRLRAPMVYVDLGGITITGSNLDLPVEALSQQALADVLQSQQTGSLTVKIQDLETFRDLLPPVSHQFLPITGELHATIDRGRITLQPSQIQGRGVELQLSEGSIALVGGDTTPALREQLLTATASAIGFALRLPEPLRIEVPGSEPVTVAGAVTGSVSGSVAQPVAQADIALRDLQVMELAIDSVGGRLDFDGKVLALTGAAIRGARRTTHGIALAVDGQASIDLGSRPGPVVRCDFRGAVPPAVLQLAPLPPHLRERIALPKAHLTATLRLPTDPAATLPTGDLQLACNGTVIGDLQPFDLACTASIDADSLVRLSRFDLTSPRTNLRASGTVGLADRQVDLQLAGRFTELQALCQLLGQHDADGAVVLEALTLRGPLTAPAITVNGRVDVTSFAPDWLPATYRGAVPTAPVALTVRAASAAAGIDVTELTLGWGAANHRLELRGTGPVPLAWSDGGLVARARPAPLAFDAKFAASGADADTDRLLVDGTVQLTKDGVRIPRLRGRSAEGFLDAKDLQAGIDLGTVLDGTLDWRGITLAGDLELGELWIGRITSRLAIDTRADGRLTGRLRLGGRVGLPQLQGTLSLERGSVALPRIAPLGQIQGTATFDDKRIALRYRAQLPDATPLEVDADLGCEQATLWAALVDRTADLNGNLSVRGLELASFRDRLPSLRELRGKITIAATVTGRPGTFQPDATVTLTGGGWRLADRSEQVTDLAATVRATRSTIELVRCAGTVPGLDARMKATGRLAVTGAALWEAAQARDAALQGFLEFEDLALDVIPRSGGLAAAQGIAQGRLDLAGTLANLRPRLTVKVRDGAVKLAGLPRIADLNARLVADHATCTLAGKATMGAGPVNVQAEYKPGAGDLLEAYRSGSLLATVTGEHVLLLRSGGLKVRSDVDLKAEGHIEKIVVTGLLTVHKSKYVKRLSLVPDLKVSSGQSAGGTFGPWSFPGGERMMFDVQVKTRDPIVIRTNVLDTDLDLNCRLRGQGSALHLAGACTSRSGTIRFPGMGMQIASLRLVFPRAAPTRPELLATASGKRHGIRITMNLRGPWDDPVITMSSSPALQPRELWSLATTGARPASLAANSAASNTAILATYVIQELLLTYVASESTEASESFVSRFTFEFGREISRDGAETWEVNFDIGDLWIVPSRFGLRFERDVYEDFNLGLVYRWRF